MTEQWLAHARGHSTLCARQTCPSALCPADVAWAFSPPAPHRPPLSDALRVRGAHPPSAWGSPASISKKQTKCTPRFSSAARGLVCHTRDGPQHHKSYIDDEARETRQQVGPSEDVKPHRPPWRRNGLIPDGRHVTRKGQSGRRAACRPGLLVRIPCPGAVASQPVSQSSLPSTVSRLGLDTPELPETAPSASPSCSQHEERNDPSEPLPRPSGRRL